MSIFLIPDRRCSLTLYISVFALLMIPSAMSCDPSQVKTGTRASAVVTTLCGYPENSAPTGPSIGTCLGVCVSSGVEGHCDPAEGEGWVVQVYGCAVATNGQACDGNTNGGVPLHPGNGFPAGTPISVEDFLDRTEFCTIQIDVGRDPWDGAHDFLVWQRAECGEVCTAPPVPHVAASPTLWPPNHQYHRIDVIESCQLTWESACGPLSTDATRVTCVSSSEPDNGLGDGDTPDDIVIIDDHHVDVRAERSGTGGGRCYTIGFEIVDAFGNVGTGQCNVGVPHSQGQPVVCGSPAGSVVVQSVCAARGSRLGTNITDLGVHPNIPVRLSDMNRQGVREIRVWPFWAVDWSAPVEGGLVLAGDRLAAILGSAPSGMTFTADLFDAHGTDTLAKLRDAADRQFLSQMISALPGRFGRDSRLLWSVGNEVQAPDDPGGFASWYRAQARAIRQASRNSSSCKISAEIVPGAAGHLDGGPMDLQKRNARLAIARASDVISLHFYPFGSPEYASNLPPQYDPTDPDYGLYWDYKSLKEWIELAPGKVRIGELAVVLENNPGQHDGDLNKLRAWIEHLRALGANQVLLWHHGATYAGPGSHLDDIGYDWVNGNISQFLFDVGLIDSPLYTFP